MRRPSQRIVFIDVGRATPGSFAVHYDREQWGDLPPVRHAGGTNFSFADGHSEYWKWKASETAEHGKSAEHGPSVRNIEPQTPEGREDLHKFQTGVWGKLGYVPGS